MSETPLVFLSVREKFARSILDGKKEYEYRRVPPAQSPPYTALIYATGGPSAVIGSATVDHHEEGRIEDLVEKTVDATPHRKRDTDLFCR